MPAGACPPGSTWARASGLHPNSGACPKGVDRLPNRLTLKISWRKHNSFRFTFGHRHASSCCAVRGWVSRISPQRQPEGRHQSPENAHLQSGEGLDPAIPVAHATSGGPPLAPESPHLWTRGAPDSRSEPPNPPPGHAPENAHLNTILPEKLNRFRGLSTAPQGRPTATAPPEKPHLNGCRAPLGQMPARREPLLKSLTVGGPPQRFHKSSAFTYQPSGGSEHQLAPGKAHQSGFSGQFGLPKSLT
jgi:hypothetical protein